MSSSKIVLCSWLKHQPVTPYLQCSLFLSLQLEILTPVMELMECSDLRVQAYANATLYSLLQQPDIRWVS